MTAKNNNFRRLFQARADKIFDAIRTLGNLTGPNYESSPEEQEYAIGQIEERLKALKSAFVNKRKLSPHYFSWRDFDNS